MPWVKCNFTIPTIKHRGQMNYFLPNGIFVYDGSHVGHVAYGDLEVADAGPQRHIEDESVPSDAQVVDHSWRYANKDGGPDGRFSNNYQIPVCLYGAIRLTSSTGLDWRLETSQNEVPSRFARTMLHGSRVLASTESPVVPVGSKYYGQPFSDLASELASIVGHYLGRLPGDYDRLLQRIAGSGNDIVLWFLRIFVPALFVALLVVLIAIWLV